jgi:hypothetical protein
MQTLFLRQTVKAIHVKQNENVTADTIEQLNIDTTETI